MTNKNKQKYPYIEEYKNWCMTSLKTGIPGVVAVLKRF